jgi:hypothetical protein
MGFIRRRRTMTEYTGGVGRARGTLGSLEGDTPEMTEVQWRAAMLEQQTNVAKWQEQWVKRDELQRWLQLGATLAIPLSAAIWKMIFRAGRASTKR